jgi:hypothetical protein
LIQRVEGAIRNGQSGNMEKIEKKLFEYFDLAARTRERLRYASQSPIAAIASGK